MDRTTCEGGIDGPVAGAALRVLLVEDAPEDAELNLLALRAGGFRVESLRVETAEALARALQERAWDLVLSDVQLPGFGGFEALRILQASRQDIPFLIVSGAIGEEVAVSAMKAGAHDYVPKSNLGRLGAVVDRELREARSRREKREAEAALRETETRYRDLFEHSPVPMWVADYSGVKAILDELRAPGVVHLQAHFEAHPEEVRRCAAAVRILEVSQSSVSLFGLQRKEDLAHAFPRFFGALAWPVFRRQLLALAEGGQDFHCELPVLVADGGTRTVTSHLSVSPGFEASLARVLISFMDITPRVEAESRLRDSRTSLEQAQRMARLGSWEWDLTRERPVWSPQMFALFGLPEGCEAPTYDEFVAMVHPEDRPGVLGAIEEVIASGEPWSIEYKIHTPDGSLRHVHERAELVLDDQDRPFRLQGTIQDITERKLMELALRDSEAKFSTLVEKAPVGIYVTDPRGRYQYVNERWCRMAGLAQEEALGDGWQGGLHPEDRAGLLAAWDQAVEAGSPWDREFRFLSREGETAWVYGSATPLLDPEGRVAGYIGINVDTTERKGLENTLKGLEKLSAKGQMAAYIAHEINNPLAGIKNAFALVERAIQPGHVHARYAELIKREIDRIAGIIRTMYHVYRPPTQDVKAISLGAAFRDIEDLVEARCRAAKVDLFVSMDDPDMSVVMNEGVLRQVLFNLVLNAIDASPEGGIVTLGAARERGATLITVEDEGSGIPPELSESVFQPGFTTKRDSDMSGLGLGLATCRGILESSGGTLAFRETERGEGTVFEVRVPVRDARELPV